MPFSKSIQSVEQALKNLADHHALELVDGELVKEGSNWYFRIYIDKPGGVTLDDCEAYHRNAVQIVENIEYDFLEVSSPGIDRPLKTEADYNKYLGKTIEIHLYRPINGKKIFNAVLNSFTERELFVNTNGKEITISQSAVALCKPFIEFEEK